MKMNHKWIIFGFILISVVQQNAVYQACVNDYRLFCSGIQSGEGRIIACLQKNAEKLSPACKKALAVR